MLAHPGCNNGKWDFLADFRHLLRWNDRNHSAGPALRHGFDTVGLPHDLDLSFAIARRAYGQGEVTGAHTWRTGNQFLRLDHRWRMVLP